MVKNCGDSRDHFDAVTDQLSIKLTLYPVNVALIFMLNVIWKCLAKLWNALGR